jgi:hypothetical protein
LNTHRLSPIRKGEGNIFALISTRTDKPNSSLKTGEDKILHPNAKGRGRIDLAETSLNPPPALEKDCKPLICQSSSFTVTIENLRSAAIEADEQSENSHDEQRRRRLVPSPTSSEEAKGHPHNAA